MPVIVFALLSILQLNVTGDPDSVLVVVTKNPRYHVVDTVCIPFHLPEFLIKILSPAVKFDPEEKSSFGNIKANLPLCPVYPRHFQCLKLPSWSSPNILEYIGL